VKRILFPLMSLLVMMPGAAQVSPYTPKEIPPPAKRAERIAITAGPAPELFKRNEAIIRWTSTNPGGTDEHFGIVHYGTDPGQLTHMAKSHIRLNQNHRYTVFRVRVTDLEPATTYYYIVDSTNADGTPDGLKSTVRHFVTPKEL
jgi:phosphodiesterase/alkaline phosphatase D-like protein